MWKFVARGIRESLIGRRTCSNIYLQNAQDLSTDSNHDRKIISKTKSCTFPVYFRCCGNAKYSGTKDKEKNDKWDAKYSWTEAVGWSSILAIGWVVCQSMCLQQKLIERGNVNSLEKWRHKLLITPQYQPTKILKNFLLPQSNYLLAKPQEPRNFSINEQVLVDEAPNIAKPYGPVTAEKALEEAVNEFASTHNSILGELELDFGTKAIEEKRYDDAVTHFINGVDFSSIKSMFNLGLCHELGLGTSVDFKKAAIYYKKAAEEGHADAMYNLAVFHAQGKGGLTEDLNEARDLFRQAAKKGHVQAKKALKLENTFKKPNLEYSSDYNLQVKTLSNIQNNVVTKLLNYNHDLGYETNEKFYSDNNLKEKTPTEIFLEMLGIREKQNAIPIINLKNNF